MPIIQSGPIPLLLLLAVLLPSPALSLIYQLPITSTGSLRTRLIRAGLWRTVLERLRHDLVFGTQQEFFKGYYVANISVGTPPQQLLVAMQTASPNFWLISPNCSGKACTGRAEVTGHRRTPFQTNASSTLMATGMPFNISYQWKRSPTSGHLFRDKVQLGPLHWNSQTFGLAEHVTQVVMDQPLDGIFGLAWPALSAYSERPPLMNILDQLDEPVFTVWVDWRRPASMGGPGGFVTFGGKDEENCEGPWRDVRLKSRAFWQFSIQKVQIGPYRTYRHQLAIADTGTALIGCPYSHFQMIVEATKAIFSQEDDIFTVPCNRVRELPPIILTINGTDYAIPPGEYILDVGLREGKCALGLFGMYSNGFDADWVLGDIFFDSFCTMFDYGKGKLSLALAKDAVPKNAPNQARPGANK